MLCVKTVDQSLLAEAISAFSLVKLAVGTVGPTKYLIEFEADGLASNRSKTLVVAALVTQFTSRFSKVSAELGEFGIERVNPTFPIPVLTAVVFVVLKTLSFWFTDFAKLQKDLAFVSAADFCWSVGFVPVKPTQLNLLATGFCRSSAASADLLDAEIVVELLETVREITSVESACAGIGLIASESSSRPTTVFLIEIT